MQATKGARGVPVVARTADGLLRLRTIPEELAPTLLAEQLRRYSLLSPHLRNDTGALAAAAVDAGCRTDAFPSTPLLADDIAARLPPTSDRVGSPPRFMDDAPRRSV
jgi:hypothetical protein